MHPCLCKQLKKACPAAAALCSALSQRGDVAIIDIDILRPGTTDSLVGGARNGFRLDTSNSDATFIPGGWV